MIGESATVDEGVAYVVYGKATRGVSLGMSTLTAGDGFRIKGDVGSGKLGFSVSSVGDVNGDGYDDVIVGAPEAGNGVSYLIFGKGSGLMDIDLGSLSVSDGIKITGESSGDKSGYSVSGLGDVNGDGYGDFAVSSLEKMVENANEGVVYVIYGKGSWETVDLSSYEFIDSLTGTAARGFKIKGEEDERLGTVRRAGDVNGDGYADVIVGSSLGSYVIYGSDAGQNLGVSSNAGYHSGDYFEMEAGDGFAMLGADASGVGDVNGDGYADLAVRVGESLYVIYGNDSQGQLDLSAGLSSSEVGFEISLEDSGDEVDMVASSAGDVNGDGFDDILIGAPNAEDGNTDEGKSYLVYGGDFEEDVMLGSGTITGTSGDESFVGSSGADEIDTMGGADSVRGGAGDDVVVVMDGDFRLVDGGRGVDTLRLVGGGDWELGDFVGKVENVEKLDLQEMGGSLRIGDYLDLASLGGKNEGGKTIFELSGYAENDLFLGEGWEFVSRTGGKLLLEQNNYQLKIDADMLDVSFSEIGLGMELDGFGIGIEIVGGESGFKVGGSVASAGDVNGDGYEDFILGAVGGGLSGSAFVVYGKGNGLVDIDFSDWGGVSEGFTIVGEFSGDEFGYSVSGAGDVNGDGYDDVIVGAPNGESDDSETDTTDEGVAYVVYGKATRGSSLVLNTLTSGDGFRIKGDVGSGKLGFSVSSVGDVNGDGYDDVIVGAPEAGNGVSYLIFGKGSGLMDIDLGSLSVSDGIKITGGSSGDKAGYSVSGLGDINGDGYDDFAVGAPDESAVTPNDRDGVVYVFLGKGSWSGDLDVGNGSDYSFKLYGGEGEVRGERVDGIGDFNGDGYDDFAVVGGNLTDVVYGKAGSSFEDISLFSPPSGYGFNFIHGINYVLEVGDVNGDGYDDMAVRYGENLYVIYGNDSQGQLDLSSGLGSVSGFEISVEDSGDDVDMVVSGAGDVNGDGFDDILIGAPNAEDGNTDEGKSYLIYGGDFEGDVIVGSGTITGTSGDESFVGSNGADVIDTMGGADSVRAGAGDDVVVVMDGDFRLVDGGRGVDTLRLVGGSWSLDDFVGSVENVEKIEVSGSGGSLSVGGSLGVGSLGGKNEGGKTVLEVSGEAGSRVLIGEGWEFVSGSSGMLVLEENNYQLKIDRSMMDVVFISVDLGSLSSGDGFKMVGEDEGDNSGYSVSSIGDVNGDGYEDFILGAPNAEDTTTTAGEGISYVIYGKASGLMDVDLSSLSVADGFRLVGGHGGDSSGDRVSGGGDVNGDGLADIIIGARDAERDVANTVQGSRQGVSYVIYGKTTRSGDVNLFSLGSVDGFKIIGDDIDSGSGGSVSNVGDVNGDGYDDVLVGAGTGDNGKGVSYLIFGDATSSLTNVDLRSLTTSRGIKITGANWDDEAGNSVSGIGDFNGDGYDDFAIGALAVTKVSANSSDGAVYVILGKGSGYADLDLSNSSDYAFEVYSGAAEQFGLSMSGVGDFNGDGYDDFVAEGNSYSGALIYGKAGSSFGDLNLVSPPSGYGFYIGGTGIKGVGDVNGDGYDDLVARDAGTLYVIYGNAGQGAVDLTNGGLGSVAGFEISVEDSGDEVGLVVSGAGDVNGDGFEDILIGAPNAEEAGGGTNEGVSYVVYGGDIFGEVMAGSGTITGTSGDESLVGSNGADVIDTMGGADSVRAGAGDDVVKIIGTDFFRIDGGSGFDTLELRGTGLSLDLSAIGNNKIENIESVDLTGTGNNSLAITALELEALGGLTEGGKTKLIVEGNSGDAVTTTDDWTANSTAMYDGTSYNLFELGNYQLLIDTDVDVTGIV